MQRSGVQRAESSASAKTWSQEKGETNGVGMSGQGAGEEVGEVGQAVQNSSRMSGFYSGCRGSYGGLKQGE